MGPALIHKLETCSNPCVCDTAAQSMLQSEDAYRRHAGIYSPIRVTPPFPFWHTFSRSLHEENRGPGVESLCHGTRQPTPKTHMA